MLKKMNPFVRCIDRAENVRFGYETVAHDCRFIYVLDGYCDIMFDGEHHLIKEEDAVYLPPYTPYTVRGAVSASLFILHFDLTGKYEAYKDSLQTLSVVDPASCAKMEQEVFAPFDRAAIVRAIDLRALLSDIEKIIVLPPPYARDHASCLTKELLLFFAEQNDQENDTSLLTKKIIDYVDAHFADAKITNQDIAAHFGYHPYRIRCVMRKETGKTLKTYIIWYRLDIAANMLSVADTSITDIADVSGFESQSYQNVPRRIWAHTGRVPRSAYAILYLTRKSA